jgi:all-trans-retinol 13,14-reductase
MKPKVTSSQTIGFTERNVEKHYDAIVVGSGISGLTCAVMLAKCGWRILVLERHDKAGGTMHTFHLGNGSGQTWEFDSGVHYRKHQNNTYFALRCY